MKKKKQKIIASVAVLVAVVLAVIFLWNRFKTKIEFSFVFDDFSFMNHTLSEGDKMNTIMQENNISADATSLHNTNGCWVEYDERSKAWVLMYPTKYEDGRQGASSSYWVYKDPAEKGHVSFSVNKYQSECYQGPIHIGDSLEKVYQDFHIEEFMESEMFGEEYNQRFYTCDSNLGEVTLIFSPYTGLKDLDKYETPAEYLKAGNFFQYGLDFGTYHLFVTIDESQTVSNVGMSYNPNSTKKKRDDKKAWWQGK